MNLYFYYRPLEILNNYMYILKLNISENRLVIFHLQC